LGSKELPTVGVGIMAYNEARNIRALLQSLIAQRTQRCRLSEIVVVASGCTDDTEAIVDQMARRDPRIRLITQSKREGKSRAINLYLRGSETDFRILASGDTLPADDAIESLIRPMLEDPRVGMTGGHVVPVNGDRRFIGHAVHTLWRLHHRLATEAPKMGEIVAFRNIVKRIPEDSAVDEVSIEADVTRQGLCLKYIPEAIIRNKGPETISDFIKQRRRIHAGHLAARRVAGYAPSTMSLKRVGRVFVADAVSRPTRLAWCLGTAALEATGRMLGAYDHYVSGRSHAVWEIAVTTKDVQGNR
jgi:cellulose synthase/poly-beta-1,6-N-acetylglucosamine synthase-like glycosyltransferase